LAELEVKEIMAKIPSHFNKELAKGINAKIQFSLSGEQGGEWVWRSRIRNVWSMRKR
jgi:hypothetical protein